MQGQPGDNFFSVDAGHGGPISWPALDTNGAPQQANLRAGPSSMLAAGGGVLLPAPTSRNHHLTSPLEVTAPIE